MKIFGYSIFVHKDRWTPEFYEGITIANTQEEAIGMILHETPHSKRSDFEENGELSRDYIREIDPNVPKVHCLNCTKYEE